MIKPLLGIALCALLFAGTISPALADSIRVGNMTLPLNDAIIKQKGDKLYIFSDDFKIVILIKNQDAILVAKPVDPLASRIAQQQEQTQKEKQQEIEQLASKKAQQLLKEQRLAAELKDLEEKQAKLNKKKDDTNLKQGITKEEIMAKVEAAKQKTGYGLLLNQTDGTPDKKQKKSDIKIVMRQDGPASVKKGDTFSFSAKIFNPKVNKNNDFYMTQGVIDKTKIAAVIKFENGTSIKTFESTGSSMRGTYLVPANMTVGTLLLDITAENAFDGTKKYTDKYQKKIILSNATQN